MSASDLAAFIATHTWPLERAGEAMHDLAQVARLGPRDVEPPKPPRTLNRRYHRDDTSFDRALERWMTDVAEWFSVEAEPVDSTYADLSKMVESSAPSLLRVRGGDLSDPSAATARASIRYFAVTRCRKKYLYLLTPEHEIVRVPAELVRRAIAAEVEAPVADSVERMLAQALVPEARRPGARAALFASRLGARRVDGSFVLRLPPSASFARQATRANLFYRLGVLLVAHAVEYTLFLGSWALIGRGALGGRIDHGYLIGWALLLLTLVPIRVLVSWTSGRIAIEVGGLLKQRLLVGALALDTEDVRTRGAGQLFGRVAESEAVEALALGGGIVGMISILEIFMAALVLAAGVAPAAHVIALFAWIFLAVVLSVRYYKTRGAWTEARLDMTHDLVERMVGHRTRLAQEAPDNWHEGEDQAVERYLDRSRKLDRLLIIVSSVFPRGWLVIGIALMVPAFASEGATSAGLAISLGGVMLARGSLTKLLGGLSDLASAGIAWKEVGPLFNAAGDAPAPAHPDAALAASGDGMLVEAADLMFSYPQRAVPVLKGLSLRVRPGERLLLEGPSGCGKSTLGAVLAGLRDPDSGLLLLAGLDRRTLGVRGFRRRVVAAPQFQENHVISATFAFNLLMGRAWPARAEDMAAAEAICRELDLGALLERMPAGLMQMVGETGWQLSHGEKSRLYIARALLQEADLIVLDESFAALDPETLEKAMKCVLARSKTLLVIAHP